MPDERATCDVCADPATAFTSEPGRIKAWCRACFADFFTGPAGKGEPDE